MFSNTNLLIGLVSFCIVAIIALFLYLWRAKKIASDPNVSYNRQLDELLRDDTDNVFTRTTNTSNDLISRWNRHWTNVFGQMGWASYNENSSRAGLLILAAFIVVSIVVSYLARSYFLGPLAGILLLYGITVAVREKMKRQESVMNAQLPGFLFAMKANVQANETPERALIKVVDTMPSPLKDDLMVAKNMVLANSTFHDALEELSRRTTSPVLKFLCACMMQAATSGANLEDQLTVIQENLDEKTRSDAKIREAVKSMMPAIWVSVLGIPLTFIGMMFMNSTTRSFWFVNPYSWIALIAIAILYVAGLWINRALVDSIRKM